MSLFFIVFLCICRLQLNIVHSWKDTLYGVTVQVEETSGRISVSNENNSLTVAFKEIIELAQNGVTEVGTRSPLKHNFKNFDYQVFYSGGLPEFVDVFSEDAGRNISVYKKNFTAKLDGPGATFNLEIWVYGNDTIIKNSNSEETYQVHNGTVKFAFSIDNWIFCGSNDTDCLNYDRSAMEYGYFLDVYASYSAARKDEKPKRGRIRGRSEITDRRPLTYDYGGGDVTSSQMYMLNYTWYSMLRGYPKQVRKFDHNFVMKNYAVIRFPVFYSPIYYNAFVNISSLQYMSSSPNHINSYVSTIFLSILTFLCTWYIH